jgi:hypothetical protein
MPHSTQTFRLFVSSTFSDLKEERNALQEQVFPKSAGCAKSMGVGCKLLIFAGASVRKQVLTIKQCRSVLKRSTGARGQHRNQTSLCFSAIAMVGDHSLKCMKNHQSTEREIHEGRYDKGNGRNRSTIFQIVIAILKS